MESLGFALFAGAALVSALFVVRSSNLVHAVLWLAASLLATAALYAMLGASFLAGVQALVYVGGVVTLMIFGVMITRKHEGLAAPAESARSGAGIAVAGLLFGAVVAAIRATPGLDAPDQTLVQRATPADLGRALVVDHVLAFEALSLLLLVAIIGAIVIARRRDPEGASRPANVSTTTPSEVAK